jgi:hypothetical protein
MPTFTEVLPASKSNPHRAMRYTPACKGVGVVEIDDARTSTRYAVAVLPFGGVRFTKSGGAENYVVTPATCECKGFVFGRGQLCKHALAVHALFGNGWLDADDRETVGDRHDDADERDQWYATADALGRPLACELGGC